MSLEREDWEFLERIENYVNRRPLVGAYVARSVAAGIEKSRREQAEKSADLETVIAFLLKSGKLERGDKEFVLAKLEKWNHICSLNWSGLIAKFKSAK